MNKKDARHQYSVKIPQNATPEEIKEFMKKFIEKWNKKPNEPSSKQEQD